MGISTRHALALVNKGGATAAEIVAFARRVRDGVLDRFGVALAPEPVLVGFAPEEGSPGSWTAERRQSGIHRKGAKDAKAQKSAEGRNGSPSLLHLLCVFAPLRLG